MFHHSLSNLLCHLAHFSKFLGALCLTQSRRTVSVIAAPTKGFLPYRADELRPIVALVTRDVLFLETEVDVLEHGVTGNQHGIKVFEPVLKIRFKISAVCGDTLFQNGGCTLLKTGAQVKCLAFRKVRLSVITDFLKQFSFRKSFCFSSIR